jgi:H/ACA ribonucleoprotein complex subunit 4
MGKLPFERSKRERVPALAREVYTASKYGEDPNKRPIEKLLNRSIVNIDKPKGPTSHQVSSYVQKILGVNKGGHSGTLDPKVTGILPVAIGKATRIVQALLPAGKEYVCLMHLHKEIPEGQVKTVIESFKGRIKQLPPIKSAVKRQLRYRKIYYITVHEVVGQDVLFTVGCQAGTYIRKLCHDIGEKLGCGAHMAELRRTKAGPFNEKHGGKLCTLQDLTDAMHYYKNEKNESFLRNLLQPIENAVDHLPKVYILDSCVDAICHGASLAAPGIAEVDTDIQVDDLVAIMTMKEELVAIGKARLASNDMAKAERGMAVILNAVFMDPGTYPKMQKLE